MDRDYIFGVIGGDMRQVKLIQMLAAENYRVNICGFENCEEDFDNTVICSDLETAVRNSDCVILGLPYSSDDLLITAPYADTLMTLEELYASLQPNQLLVGGKLNASVYAAALQKGCKAVDYFLREELAVENAVPTAEGTIQIMMEELPITIQRSKCLITGYGRIGKILAQRLAALGADVAVAARSVESLAWIKANGYKPLQILRRENLVGLYDAIINTIPTLLFDAHVLEQIPANTLLIDLASKPGGIDFNAAAMLNLKVIWALSLPGKVAPVTSGEIIKTAIFNIINEEE